MEPASAHEHMLTNAHTRTWIWRSSTSVDNVWESMSATLLVPEEVALLFLLPASSDTMGSSASSRMAVNCVGTHPRSGMLHRVRLHCQYT